MNSLIVISCLSLVGFCFGEPVHQFARITSNPDGYADGLDDPMVAIDPLEMKGNEVNLTKYQWFKGAVSARMRGIWIFYEANNFDAVEVSPEQSGLVEYVSAPYVFANQKFVGSINYVRYAGKGSDYTAHTITFYSGTYFQGIQEMLVGTGDLSTNNTMKMSMILTGIMEWTLYTLDAEPVCIRPMGQDEGNLNSVFIPDIASVGLVSPYIIRVREGCTGKLKPVKVKCAFDGVMYNNLPAVLIN